MNSSSLISAVLLVNSNNIVIQVLFHNQNFIIFINQYFIIVDLYIEILNVVQILWPLNSRK